MSPYARQSVILAVVGFLSIHLAVSTQREQKGQQPRFNVQVNLVSLDVEVLDSLGNPVLGLAKKDFTVKENDRPMEISNFAWLADRPISLAMVLDTSGISPPKLVTFKRFLRELAHELAPTDDLCLYSFDSRDAYLEMDFSSKRYLLMDALDNIGVPSNRSGGVLQELFTGAPPTGLAIDMALDKLRKIDKGKKALLVISNRFRGLGPATVEHVQLSGCTLLTLGLDNKVALLIRLGGDKISRDQLMRESGGRQFSAETEDMTGVCRKIAYSLKNYYALGYLTEIGPADKKPRRIEVQMPGQEYTINYRRSYVVTDR
ncbi:MAG: VWA domain-containing protein [Acidobacteriota bacterium]|jgi:VWFA-related protein